MVGIGMKPFCTCSLSVLMYYGLKGVLEVVVGHNLFVDQSFFLMSVKFPFSASNILGYITQILELREVGGIVGKSVVKLVDCFVV